MSTSSMQKTIHILIPFFVYFVVHDVAQVVLIVLLNASLANFGDGYVSFVKENTASVNGVLNALALFVGMLVVLPMARKELKRVPMDRKQVKGRWGSYVLLLVLAVSLAVGMNLLLAFIGLTQASEQYTEVAARQYGVAFGLGILLYGVVSPLVEEVVFRGLIYNRMKQYFRIPVAIPVCGILFGIYHGNIVQGIYGCILGVVITLVYEWYGSFWAPVLFHGAANMSVFAISYDAENFKRLGTPLWCLVCMGLSFVSLWGIVRIRMRRR